MAILDLPVTGHYYRLANAENFHVLSVDGHCDEIIIQYSDGGQEVLDLDTWNLLEAVPIETMDEQFEEHDIEEIDFDKLGVGPGTEPLDNDLILSDEQWY